MTNETTMVAIVAIIAIVGLLGLMLFLSQRDGAGGLIIKKTEDGYIIMSIPTNYKMVQQ